ncbi:hypothetical protein EVAR_89768_1 [Eumeta japonica]|uniref:Uncharacterized protein n=1 Tax=Eumeta variegata TaxID=151549 RepID=A0A4C1XDP8_EUMVA|nr:hypothetical protein EVAR_89768_1 [Eumeta japonica]
MKIFEECLLPVVMYKYQPRFFTVGLLNKLRVAKRAIERAMLEFPFTPFFGVDVAKAEPVSTLRPESVSNEVQDWNQKREQDRDHG